MIQDFQDCRTEVVPKFVSSPCRHLGEDLFYLDGSSWNSENKKILAIANGYVVASGVKKGFAGYIILKHYLSNNSDDYILSIYAHLKTTGLPTVGDFFKKGKNLSTLATKVELKPYIDTDPHLHIEIRKSKKITGLSDTYLNYGYEYSNGRYYDPTDIYFWNTNSDINEEKGFIESHQSSSVTDKEGSSHKYKVTCDSSIL